MDKIRLENNGRSTQPFRYELILGIPMVLLIILFHKETKMGFRKSGEL